jgi:2-oxoglutarate ferredoxin oxidoreductase subunit beta
MTDAKTLSKNDLKSDQEVRWCPGCGDYAILACVQGVLADLGIPREQFCLVSGIGCSSRFPYYMDTYGFHSIHGRAPAIATGVKVSNPDLSVWLVTGDGDGLSIGGNHTIHLLRRNVDVKVLLFNNEIYGLTKGQYSPTSPVGQKSKSTPFGSVDRPFNPVSLALGAGATFVASTIDTHMKHMAGTLKAAAAHKGAAFVEIYQNCVIFNDGCFDDFAEKSLRDEKTIDLIPGKPLVYGKEHEKGIKMEGFELMRVPAAEASIWDPSTASAGPGFLLSQLHSDPEMPNPIGIFRDVQAPIFDEGMRRQITTAIEKKGKGSFRDLVYSGDTWTV